MFDRSQLRIKNDKRRPPQVVITLGDPKIISTAKPSREKRPKGRGNALEPRRNQRAPTNRNIFIVIIVSILLLFLFIVIPSVLLILVIYNSVWRDEPTFSALRLH